MKIRAHHLLLLSCLILCLAVSCRDRKSGGNPSPEQKGGSQTKKNPGGTELHQAVLNGDIEKLKEAIAGGVDLKTRDDGGRTTLHIVLEKSDITALKTLIEAGADIAWFFAWQAADDRSYHYLIGPRAELN